MESSWQSKIFLEHVFLYRTRKRLVERDFLRGDSGDLGYLLFKSTYTGLVGIFVNYIFKSTLVYLKCAFLEPMLFHLLGYKELTCYL